MPPALLKDIKSAIALLAKDKLDLQLPVGGQNTDTCKAFMMTMHKNFPGLQNYERSWALTILLTAHLKNTRAQLGEVKKNKKTCGYCRCSGQWQLNANDEHLKSEHYNTHNTNCTNYQARKFGVPTRALNAIPEAPQSIWHLPEGSLIFSHLLERSLNLIWHLPERSLNWSGTFPKEA
ncbi:hypothetical protein B0H17DRAFT_1149598 [Mycena rosella]|uniref:Uncharacterized protein n=1 Tax=Mycena rosella TaxID=1033263 RepID=A0AAD7FPM2_MYCRO|nr:hypothetical protein B0H17DRAFT_1149598 [Mycena rosella]